MWQRLSDNSWFLTIFAKLRENYFVLKRNFVLSYNLYRSLLLLFEKFFGLISDLSGKSTGFKIEHHLHPDLGFPQPAVGFYR